MFGIVLMVTTKGVNVLSTEEPSLAPIHLVSWILYAML